MRFRSEMSRSMPVYFFSVPICISLTDTCTSIRVPSLRTAGTSRPLPMMVRFPVTR